MSKREKRQKKKSIPGFLQKTLEILENPVNEDCIAWCDDGARFVIKDVAKLQQSVLKNYFRHNKLTSFVRQLNMYDFHKVQSVNHANIFEHSQFNRNKPELLTNIHKKKPKAREREEVQSEPLVPAVLQTEVEHMLASCKDLLEIMEDTELLIGRGDTELKPIVLGEVKDRTCQPVRDWLLSLDNLISLMRSELEVERPSEDGTLAEELVWSGHSYVSTMAKRVFFRQNDH